MKRKKLITIAVTALTILLCAALCLSALSLYRAGAARRASGSAAEPIFSREAVGRQLNYISPLAGLWLAAVIVSIVTGQTGRGRPAAPRPVSPRAFREHRLARAVLYAAAVLLVILGIANEGLRDVFVKAANICTECIGLG